MAVMFFKEILLSDSRYKNINMNHSPLSKKENLKLVLQGQSPRWVPFALNFWQWFIHHKKFNSLPQDLRHCKDYLEAMIAFDCDIFSRNIDGGHREHDSLIQPDVRIENSAIGPITTTEYSTPYGKISRTDHEQTNISTSHQVSYLVKDWDKDGDAFKYYLEQHQYCWDEEAFLKTHHQIGDNGIVNVSYGCTPLKMLHNQFGLDHSCLFAYDEPEEAKALCDNYWESKMKPNLQTLANHPLVDSVILMDNVDTPFYSPNLAADFWTPYVKEATEMMRNKGKTLFVHACGKLASLNDEFMQARISGLEGISHPHLGDWSVTEAQNCHSQFIFIGGFSAREQESMTDQELRNFYHGYLDVAKKDRFIFSSSCQTAIGTTWERMKLVRDICREWGGTPPLEKF
jgi:hypothetical protein